MHAHLSVLLEKCMAGTASPAERAELLLLLDDPAHELAVQEHFGQLLEAEHATKELPQEKLAAMMQAIVRKEEHRMPAPRTWWAAAAAVLLLGIGTWWMMTKHQPAKTLAVKVDVAPAKSGAVLTLADGSQMVLDSIGNGVIASQNGSQVMMKDGELAYQPAGTSTGELAYNTMTTPKGRQFQLTLPDGTKAWLNAASSITYPTIFNGAQRKVSITGEVYLEVSKNAAMPFMVNVRDQAAVEVLGTSFNINAYADENSINTTLLDGAVRIQSVVLKPGQQARIMQNQTVNIIEHADVNKIMAWKNGLFNFQGLTLGEVMRQLEKWYDIKVKYSGSAQNIIFGGEMYRNVNLSDVLDMFKDMGVKYEWDGNTLTIL